MSLHVCNKLILLRTPYIRDVCGERPIFTDVWPLNSTKPFKWILSSGNWGVLYEDSQLKQLTYLLTYLLTPWCRVLLEKLTWFAASQEIPRISRNPKVHYRTHKLPPPVPILGQPNPVHIPTSHLLEIHPNITHPSMPRSPQWSLSLRFPHQDPIHPPPLTHTRHMPSPPHSSRFYHPHNIGWGVHLAPHYAISSIPPLPHPS